MELNCKQGFKHTDFGLIPEDWIITNLNSLVDKKRTIRYGIVQPGKYDPNGKFLIRGQDYSFGWANPEDYFRVSPQIEEKYKNARVKKGDIIITIVGAGTGKVEIIPFWLDQSNLTQTTARIAIESNKADNNYIKYYLESNKGQEQVKNYIKGAAQPGLNCGDIEKFLTILPPTLNEQKSIATALTEVDELITGLEKLISKKKDIKQGAMQQLLTPPHKGGKRLAGFFGEWVERPFTDMIWFQEGPGLRKWQFTSKGIKVINITNLVDGYLDLEKTQRHISLDEFNNMYKHFEVDEGDIVVASSGNSYCKTSVVRKQDLPLVMNTSVIRFKPLKNLNYNLLLILLKSDLFKDQIDLLITGGAQPNFGPVHLPKVFFTLPESMEEQNAIGQILSDIDTEINKLETKKEKYSAIKQGMMQELLTGKTRLI